MAEPSREGDDVVASDMGQTVPEILKMINHLGCASAALITLAACAGSADGGGAGGSSGSASTSSAGGAGLASVGGAQGVGGAVDAAPAPPENLVFYLTGEAADAAVPTATPEVVLMGGGADVDAIFERWATLVPGGDVVVLRASGADGYNAYLFDDIGGFDSVETLLVTTPELANDDYVAYRLGHAEAIFIAGGDQAAYVAAWKGTRLFDELEAAVARGAVVGGTSAGAAILGDVAFTALEGTVYSDEALADPYNAYMTFDADLCDLDVGLGGAIVDTHFSARDRMGRLVGFVARTLEDGAAPPAIGIGVDEATALVVGAGGASTVFGAGSVYVVVQTEKSAVCDPGAPLEVVGDTLYKLRAGDTIDLATRTASVASSSLGASGGVTVPADPY
ncbi:MAG: cyanophycinase [Polyangiaceae bacterium]